MGAYLLLLMIAPWHALFNFVVKITFIDKCVLCPLFLNIVIDRTDAYINTIIDSQEDFQGTHFSISMFNTGTMFITDDTHSYFSNSSIVVLSPF